MIADLGTRRNTSLDIIKPTSFWINGYPWMSKHSDDFPTLSAQRISPWINHNYNKHPKKYLLSTFIIPSQLFKIRFVRGTYFPLMLLIPINTALVLLFESWQ